MKSSMVSLSYDLLSLNDVSKTVSTMLRSKRGPLNMKLSISLGFIQKVKYLIMMEWDVSNDLRNSSNEVP